MCVLSVVKLSRDFRHVFGPSGCMDVYLWMWQSAAVGYPSFCLAATHSSVATTSLSSLNNQTAAVE